MKRYYLARIVNDPDYGYTPVVTTLGNFNVVPAGIHVDPQTGVPTHDWVLCLVSGRNLQPLNGRPDVVRVPDMSKDAGLSAIAKGEWDSFASALAGWGITPRVSAATGASGNSVRDLLHDLGRRFNTAFNADAADVPDIE